MGKILTQLPLQLDYCLSLQSGPSLLPVQPLTYGRVQAVLPAGGLVPSLRPDPLGLAWCRLAILPAIWLPCG